MRKVEVTTHIRTTPTKLISAFIKPDMLRGWWSVERTLIDPKPGGVYTLAWNVTDKGFGFVSTGIIKSYQSESTLIVDNFVYLNPEKSMLGPMSLTIKAKHKGNVAEIYLCQDGYQPGGDWDWYHDVVTQAWPKVVQNLKEYLEKENS